MQKKLLAIAITGALAAPTAAQAVSFQVSGHVNRLIMFADDGRASDVMQADGAASQSRVTISGSDNLGIGGMKAGVLMEWSVASNMSSNVTIKGVNGNGAATDSAFNIRHSALWFTGNWGKITLGHTSGAFDGVIYAGDQSGSVFLAGIEAGLDHGGAILIRDSAGNGTQGNLASAFGIFDGGRYDLVRYDTPSFGPVSAGVAVGDNGRWDVAGRLSTSFAGHSVVGAIGYEDNEQNSGQETWGGGIGVLFSQGTNIHFAYSERDISPAVAPACLNVSTPAGGNAARCFGATDRTAETWYVKLGHRWGNNSVAVDYQETDDLARRGDEATTWGIGFAHDIPGPNVQLYTGYRNFDLDRPNTSTEDVDIFNIGARVRF